MPVVEVRGGVVSIRSTWVASCDWTGNHPERPAEVALNAGIPWDVEVRGASRLLADLSGLRLGSLSVEGGVTNLTFDDRRIGATGGELVLRSRGYEDAVDRYDIAVTGGANNMSIERQQGDREGADRDQEGE